MPYIKEEQKLRLCSDNLLPKPHVSGELNYLISKLCHNYVRDYGLNYHNINEVIGALECAKQEFYRRIASPYEENKIKENGDI